MKREKQDFLEGVSQCFWENMQERDKKNRETKQTNPTLVISVVANPPW